MEVTEDLCQLTLTGHRRRVTAARFCTLPHQVVTGSADRTVRRWDLHRAACESDPQVNNNHLATIHSLMVQMFRCAGGAGDVLLQRPGLCRPPDHHRTLGL